jgi:hypothetical protein
VPSYTVGYIDVYRNGVMLGTADFTATTGTTVVLATGATTGDLIRTISFYVSSVLNALPTAGGTISGSLIVTGTETVPTITSPASTPLTLQSAGTTAVTIQTSGGLSFANTTDVGAYNAVLGYRNNHFTGQRSNTVTGGTTSTMLTLVFGLNGAAIVRVVDTGTVYTYDYFTNVYEYFVTCFNGTVTATLKQSQLGTGAGSYISTSTSSSTFNVRQTSDASLATMHDTAVDVLAVAAGNFNHATVSITMAANN